MTVSNATINPQYMEMTPGRIKFNNVDLGGTAGNIKVSVSYPKAEMKIDQLGETVVDRRVSGFNAKIELILSEVNLASNWKVAFPNATLIGANPYSIFFQSKVGESDLSLAHALLIHPLSLADANLAGDYTFFKAVAESVSEVTFGPTEQQGLKVVFNVYPDTSVVPARFWLKGDPSIGLVGSSAGTPVNTGTGNGLMTSVVTHDAGTKTEVVTAQVLGVPSAGEANFYVSGSVSGAIGDLLNVSSTGVAFTSSIIDFVITAGSTAFVVGDTITVATTAANWI